MLRGKRLGVWGVAFKPDTDDVRFAPALCIIRQLLSEGALIQAYDPQATEKARQEIPEVTYCRDVYEASQGVDAIVLLTESMEFQQVDWARLAGVVERPLVVDGRNFLAPKRLRRMDFSISELEASGLARRDSCACRRRVFLARQS